MGHMGEWKTHDFLIFLFTTKVSKSTKKKVVNVNLKFDLCVFTGSNFRYIEYPFPNGDVQLKPRVATAGVCRCYPGKPFDPQNFP